MNVVMKRLALVALTLGAVACQQKEAETSAPATLDQPQQKQAYALGMQVGNFISRNLQDQQALGISLDAQLVARGFTDGLAGKAQLKDEEAQKVLQELDGQIGERRQAQAQAEQEKNTAAGKTYLADNAKREGVKTTASGLQYEVVAEGTGAQPKATDTVTVHYTGTLIDGTKFDSSVDRGEPATFALNRVIPGWTEGLQLMKQGAKYKFFIPAELAYGPRGAGAIPPNSVLLFDVELLKVEAAPAAAQ